MDFSQPFSVLNEKLRPRVTSSEQLYSSLSRVESRQLGHPASKYTYYRATVLPKEPEPEPKVSVTTAEPEGPDEPESSGEKGDFEGSSVDLLALNSACLMSELGLKEDGGEEELGDDESGSQADEKDSVGAMASEEAGDCAESGPDGGATPLQRACLDGTLPDLLNSGKPLSRRRTLGHYSDTVSPTRAV